MARLQTLAPGLRRVGLSATITDPEAYRGWLAPDADAELVDLVIGDPGAEPDLSILIPEDKIPWAGHSGRHAAREVMELIERHKTTLVFCNTRSLAELIFQDLWAVNDQALPIGIHHGSLAFEARRKVEAAMARGQAARAGRDRQPRPRHRLGRRRPGRPDGRAQGQLAAAAADRPRQPPARRAEQGHHRPRQPLRISRSARGARRDRRRRARPRDFPPRRARRARPAHPGGRLRRRRSRRPSCSPRCAPPRPMPACATRRSPEVLSFIATGGYALQGL